MRKNINLTGINGLYIKTNIEKQIVKNGPLTFDKIEKPNPITRGVNHILISLDREILNIYNNIQFENWALIVKYNATNTHF